MKTRMQFIAALLLLGLFSCKKNIDSTPGPEHPGEPEEPTGPVTLNTTVLKQGLVLPWEIVWGPDNHIWFTEKSGKISRLNPETKVVTPVFTINEVVTSHEGGLLGMVLHPNFNTTPHLFVAYTYQRGGTYVEKIVRYTYASNTLTSPHVLIDNIYAAGTHNGSRLVIVGDKIFITTGDSENTALSQNTSTPNGKVLRLNLDGSIPSDNPIAGNPYWSRGHRNPQGLVYANNKLYSSEHGPGSDDEINIIEKGKNYGWPDVLGYCNTGSEQNYCNANNIAEPIKAWSPTIAPAGLAYYQHTAIPQWNHSLLLATLKDATLYQMKLDNSRSRIESTTTYFKSNWGRLRDVCISPAGNVYLCTSNGSDDKIIEIRPNK